MPLSLKMRAVLLMARLAGGKPLHELPVAEARQATVMRIPKSRTSVPLAGIANRAIPGPAGDIPIRIYTPEGVGPFPLVVYFHGGGFVVGSIDGSDELCRALCWGAGCMVVSVGYRLAPEQKFPAAPDDCLAATRWAADHAAELGADPTRLAVAGDSAGGNLAAVTALRIRDEGGPRLCGQLLIYPVTDYHTPPTPSYLANANGYLLTREMMVWFWGHYLNHAGEAGDPHAAPLAAPDLRGLPPALVITAEFDPLRDEGERYAERLQAAGTPAVLARYDGMIHGFLLFADLFDESRRAIEEATLWVRQALAQESELERASPPAKDPAMDTTSITRERVDELLQFLPLLEAPGQEIEPAWHGLDSAPDREGVRTMPYPTYPPVVEAFFRVAGQPCWSDYAYDPALAANMTHSDEAIAAASLAEIKTMLTYCVRGERFADGYWGVMVRSGRIGAILRRLEQLRESVEGR